jgi:hypothetical protein
MPQAPVLGVTRTSEPSLHVQGASVLLSLTSSRNTRLAVIAAPLMLRLNSMVVDFH